jgi:hypothetical protein
MNDQQKVIGGFFELELPTSSLSYHTSAIALSTGRACLRLMIKNLKITKCYVPFYTCDALYDPFRLENVELEYYGLNEDLEPAWLPDLNQGEYFLYINYFGIKSSAVEKLIEHYSDSVLIDNTHLFFHKGYKDNWSFTSARKYFGVPDGAYLYAPMVIDLDYPRFTDASVNHNVLRLLGKQEESYKAYEAYEKSLTSEIQKISVVSERLLALIKYEDVKEIRRNNFNYLHSHLGDINKLEIDIARDDVPFAYPFIASEVVDKKAFYKENLFVPSLWFDPCRRSDPKFAFDSELSNRLLPLPVDHRYDGADMERLVGKTRELINYSVLQ